MKRGGCGQREDARTVQGEDKRRASLDCRFRSINKVKIRIFNQGARTSEDRHRGPEESRGHTTWPITAY